VCWSLDSLSWCRLLPFDDGLFKGAALAAASCPFSFTFYIFVIGRFCPCCFGLFGRSRPVYFPRFFGYKCRLPSFFLVTCSFLLLLSSTPDKTTSERVTPLTRRPVSLNGWGTGVFPFSMCLFPGTWIFLLLVFLMPRRSLERC